MECILLTVQRCKQRNKDTNFRTEAWKRNLLFLNVCGGGECGCGEWSGLSTYDTLTCCSFCGDSLALVCGTESVFVWRIFVEGVDDSGGGESEYCNGFQRRTESVVDGDGYGCVSG